MRGKKLSKITINESEGKRKYIVRRGMAIHVDSCPINIRIFEGNSYANVTDDCSSCKFCLAYSANLGNYDFPEQFIVCGGLHNYERPADNVENVERIPFNGNDYIAKLSSEQDMSTGKIFHCNQCGFIGYNLLEDIEDLCHICQDVITIL
jgi:hypothetical protein